MSDDVPYTAGLLAKLEACLADYRREHGQGFVVGTLAAMLRKAGVGLVETGRGRSLIDERVYESALNRAHQAETGAGGLLFKLYAVERLRRKVVAWSSDQGAANDEAPDYPAYEDAIDELRRSVAAAALPPDPTIPAAEKAA